MENMKKIDPAVFNPEIFNFFSQRWLLLCAGDFRSGEYNCMTIGWGFLGTMWSCPAITVVVRPQRRTLEFLERYDSFTCCTFPEKYRDALKFLGSVSGCTNPRKISDAGLTPVEASSVAAPAFAEADCVIEAVTKFISPARAASFRDKKLIRDFYPERDFHHTIIGTITAILRAE